MVERNAVPTDQRLQIRMVRDDRGNLHVQIAGPIAVEQVVEAMVEFRDEDQQTFAPLCVV